MDPQDISVLSEEIDDNIGLVTIKIEEAETIQNSIHFLSKPSSSNNVPSNIIPISTSNPKLSTSPCKITSYTVGNDGLLGENKERWKIQGEKYNCDAFRVIIPVTQKSSADKEIQNDTVKRYIGDKKIQKSYRYMDYDKEIDKEIQNAKIYIGDKMPVSNTVMGFEIPEKFNKSRKKSDQLKSKELKETCNKTCSLCLVTIADELMFVVPSIYKLPRSSLSVVCLIKCLGLWGVCLHNSISKQEKELKDILTLCSICHSLILEGDALYKSLLTLTTKMKHRWKDPARDPVFKSQQENSFKHKRKQYEREDCIVEKSPTKFQVTPIKGSETMVQKCVNQRVPVSILPKPQIIKTATPNTALPAQTDTTLASEKQAEQQLDGVIKPTRIISKILNCGFCGMDLYSEEDLKLHSSKLHMIKLKLGSNQQASLKTHLIREIQRSDALRKCTACGREYAGRDELVEHLRHFHCMNIDDMFLAYVNDAGCSEDAIVRTSIQTSISALNDKRITDKSSEMVFKVDERQVYEKDLKFKDHPISDTFKSDCDTVCKSSVLMPNERFREISEVKDTVINKLNEKTTGTFSSRILQEQINETSAILMQETPGDRSTVSVEKGQGGQWRCRLCMEIFTSQVEHDKHKLSRHPESVRVKRIKGTGKGIICEPSTLLPECQLAASGLRCMCGTVFENQDAMNRHMNAQFPSVVIEGNGGVREQNGIDEEELEGKIKGEGGKSVKESLINHGNSIERFICSACDKEFPSSVSLVQHNKEVHNIVEIEGLVECNLCERKLHGTSSLRNHLSRVHRQVLKSALKYRCKLCIFLCRTRNQLERHMQEKHGVSALPPVKCKYCSKTYSTRYINSHIANMHINLKKYSCNFCSMKFNIEADLNAHVFYEHANNKWRCEICQLEFSKYHQLSQHRTYIHSTKVYSCQECERTFKRKGDLTEHIKRRHQVKHPNKCLHCPKMYYDRKKLRTHLITKHGVAWEDTLARTYARLQRENNCLRRHPNEQTKSAHVVRKKGMEKKGDKRDRGKEKGEWSGRMEVGKEKESWDGRMEVGREEEEWSGGREGWDGEMEEGKERKDWDGRMEVGEEKGSRDGGVDVDYVASKRGIGDIDIGQEVSITNYEGIGNPEQQNSYSVVQVTEGSENLADVSSFSYIILQET